MSKIPSESQLRILAQDLGSKAEIAVSDTVPEKLEPNEFKIVPSDSSIDIKIMDAVPDSLEAEQWVIVPEAS